MFMFSSSKRQNLQLQSPYLTFNRITGQQCHLCDIMRTILFQRQGVSPLPGTCCGFESTERHSGPPCFVKVSAAPRSFPHLLRPYNPLILLQGHKATACIWRINVTFPTPKTQRRRERRRRERRERRERGLRHKVI